MSLIAHIVILRETCSETICETKSTTNIISGDPHTCAFHILYLRLTFDVKRFISPRLRKTEASCFTYLLETYPSGAGRTIAVVIRVTSVSVFARFSSLRYLFLVSVLSRFSKNLSSSRPDAAPRALPPRHSLRGLLNFLSFPEEIRSIYFGGVWG